MPLFFDTQCKQRWPGERSIDVRISPLRDKIEPDQNEPAMIKTVYGAGYLFLATVDWQNTHKTGD
jgi:DNA-binding response OmpR family regulator